MSHLKVCLAVSAVLVLGAASQSPQYQGFGSQTKGGEGYPVVRVTNLNASGPGSLRDAVSSGRRTVKFDVAGTIHLPEDAPIALGGPYITIDGSSAPSPGITLQGAGFDIYGRYSPRYYPPDGIVTDYPGEAAHDVIIHHIRIRDTIPHRDAVLVSMGAYNVVLDHLSISGAGDGSIDVSESHDVTISYCILARPFTTVEGTKYGSSKQMYLTYGSYNLSVHHNVLAEGGERNPKLRYDGYGGAGSVGADIRNNLIWFGIDTYQDYSSGTDIEDGARANVVNNFYHAALGDPGQAIEVEASLGARAYVVGNYSTQLSDSALNGRGTESSPFPAPAVTTLDAIAGAWDAYNNAGVRPLDSRDQAHLSRITLPGAPPADPQPPTGGTGTFTLTASPSSVSPGGSLTVNWTAPSGQTSPTDWIGIYAVGAANTSYGAWGYTGGALSGTLSCTAPSPAGTYEYRYLRNNGYTDVVRSTPVTVSGGGSSFAVSASPSAVSPGGTLTVNWTAPSGQTSSRDWISVFAQGAPNTSYLDWRYTGGATSGSVGLNVPSGSGTYEVRYLLDDGYNDVARSIPIMVGTGEESLTISAGPSSAVPGQALSVSWTAPSSKTASLDWIGLYRVGDSNASYGWWSYTNGSTSGSFTVSAPSTGGSYEFRYLLNDGFTAAARSNPVTVSGSMKSMTQIHSADVQLLSATLASAPEGSSLDASGSPGAVSASSGGRSACGATGAEALIFVALVGLLRRKPS